MGFHRALTVIGLIVGLASFGFAQNSLPPIKWRTVGKGQRSNFDGANNRFLQTTGDLQTWWKETSGQSPQSVPYKIDFNKEFAVAIHLGSRKSGGYSVYVQSVARTKPAAAVIGVVEMQPNPNEMTTQSLTQPWVLVAIERSGVVDWQFRNIKRDDLPSYPSNGHSCACGCGSCGSKSDVIIWNPAPNGMFDTDNKFGIRKLGKVPFTPYEEGNDSWLSRERAFVIQDERDFAEYWLDHHREDRVAPPSTMDWRREQLLAIHLGSVPTTGYRVEIVGIERLWTGNMVVYYSVRTPRYGESVLRRANSPYASVRMSRVTEKIEFVRRDELGSNGKCSCQCKTCKCSG